MSDPVLQSESFDKAAYELSNTLNNMQPLLDLCRLQDIINQFELQVTRLRDVLGMQAENM